MNFSRPFVVAFTLLLAPSGPIAAAEPAPPAAHPALTRITDVRALSREAAAESRPVHVRGVVTWRGWRDQFTVQDDTAGIWIETTGARRRELWATDEATLAAIRVGHLVEIEGRSDPAGYAPVILPQKIRILGDQPLPRRARWTRRGFSAGPTTACAWPCAASFRATSPPSSVGCFT